MEYSNGSITEILSAIYTAIIPRHTEITADCKALPLAEKYPPMSILNPDKENDRPNTLRAFVVYLNTKISSAFKK